MQGHKLQATSYKCMRCTRCRCRCKCTVQVLSHDTDTDTGTDADAWVGEILPAPSCYVFTMVLVDRGYVDMWICVGVVFGHKCIVNQ